MSTTRNRHFQRDIPATSRTQVQSPPVLSEIYLHSVQLHGMWFVAELRRWCLAAMGGVLSFVSAVASHAAGNGKEADALFARDGFIEIQIDIPPEEVAMLQSYKRRPANWERTNVLAVVREGSVLYSNVVLHLKGSAG